MLLAPLHDGAAAPTLTDKVAFLSRRDSYAERPTAVTARETHMSWVFLTQTRVYKMKKPVRFPYLDFSTLALRETACRAELRLNRRLARDVYLDVVPLVSTSRGLRLGPAPGTIVDWLVVMRRLDQDRMLDRLITIGGVGAADTHRLATVLASFYRRAERVTITPPAYERAYWCALDFDRRVLLDARLRLADGLVRRIDAVQRRFLVERGDLLDDRVIGRNIVDAHGDLRPEHICLGEPLCIFDCLEFNAGLRANDPFDEIAFLTVECDRLGGAEVGAALYAELRRRLPRPPPQALFVFYRTHRAMLRARLAAAHLLEPHPRTPEKWPTQARDYLRLAAADARRLEQHLRK